MEVLTKSPTTVLLLDVRPAPQYASARIKGSLNLCIPTTLLKRPSFNLQKVENTLGGEQQKRKLRQWRTCAHIIAYDSGTSNLSEASTLISVLKKFTSEGWPGDPLVLRGGFSAFSEQFPDWVETDSGRESRGHQTSLSISLTLPVCDPTAISRPDTSGDLCRSIRQNVDLVDGVGQITLKLPPGMTEAAKRSLPQWLQQTCDRQDNGKLVSEKFLDIEMAEQRRMQEALTDGHDYTARSPASGGSPAKRVCRIAGIEQGLKNRYSNIYPYDHSRVRLETVSQGTCDYVNASHVQASRSNKRYIATQAPLPATFNVSRLLVCKGKLIAQWLTRFRF
jgi:protein-tyrosine phosphatase